MEVPTVLSHSFLQQQLAEQNADIPVPGARLRLRGDLQCFLTGQGSAARVVREREGAPTPHHTTHPLPSPPLHSQPPPPPDMAGQAGSRVTKGAACQVRRWATLPRELFPGGCGRRVSASLGRTGGLHLHRATMRRTCSCPGRRPGGPKWVPAWWGLRREAAGRVWSSLSRRIVDVLVIFNDESQQSKEVRVERPSDSVLCESAGHSSCDAEMGTHSANCAEVCRGSTGAVLG